MSRPHCPTCGRWDGTHSTGCNGKYVDGSELDAARTSQTLRGETIVDEGQLHWIGKMQSAEASSLELKPGQFPERLWVWPARGEPRHFMRKLVKRGAEQELLYVDYETTAGRRLRIFND